MQFFLTIFSLILISWLVKLVAGASHLHLDFEIKKKKTIIICWFFYIIFNCNNISYNNRNPSSTHDFFYKFSFNFKRLVLSHTLVGTFVQHNYSPLDCRLHFWVKDSCLSLIQMCGDRLKLLYHFLVIKSAKSVNKTPRTKSRKGSLLKRINLFYEISFFARYFLSAPLLINSSLLFQYILPTILIVSQSSKRRN